jgi:O-antigen/teichoic acid export membrane protein
MTAEELKRHIFRNSISNYVFLVVRLGLGLIMFRMIFQSLSKEEFGFWALLWSVFGFGLLLDFGFGFTAQKRVAELSAHGRWDELSRVLSTIFFCYVAIAVFLIATGFLFAPHIMEIFKVSAENRQTFATSMTIFFVGMGLAFPLGIFPEMLKGQQRISLANYIMLAGFLVSFVLVIICLKQGWGFNWLLIISLGSNLLAEIVCGFMALSQLPQVRIRPALFSRAMVQSTMRFSIYAYIITLTTVILTRTDHLILSTMLAVSTIAIYQVGAKIAEMFSSFALQIPDTLSPAAAHSHAKGDVDFLRSLLINGTRFSVMVATPMYLMCAFYLDQLLWLVSGEVRPNGADYGQTYWTGQVLLFWGYTTILTQSVSKRIFMMSGHERRLMWLGVGEAVLNLGLSVLLIAIFKNVVCVAVGSLTATFFFGWFYLWPWAAREAKLSGWKLARTVLLPTWLACAPIVGLIILGRYLTPPSFHTTIYALMTEGTLVFLLAAVCMWRVALSDGEREKCSAVLGRLIGRGVGKGSLA